MDKVEAANIVPAEEHGDKSLREVVSNSPAALIAGGLALGVVAAAVLRPSLFEGEAMTKLRATMGSTFDEVLTEARAASSEHLQSLGLTRDQLQSTVSETISGFMRALLGPKA